jgi:hypothetical protein
MSRLLRACGLLLSALCVGTVLSQAIGLGYLASRGMLNRDKLHEMVAVMQGKARASPEAPKRAGESDRVEEVSLVELARGRALASRDFELREQSLRNQADQLQDERTKLAQEMNRYNRMKTGFETQLNTLRAAAISSNEETTRLILENMKAKQAKEQVLHMLDDGQMREVVSLLSAMTPGKRSKVLAEFKTADESDKLAKILKQIRSGEPELTLIDEAKTQLQPVPAGR